MACSQSSSRHGLAGFKALGMESEGAFLHSHGKPFKGFANFCHRKVLVVPWGTPQNMHRELLLKCFTLQTESKRIQGSTSMPQAPSG